MISSNYNSNLWTSITVIRMKNSLILGFLTNQTIHIAAFNPKQHYSSMILIQSNPKRQFMYIYIQMHIKNIIMAWLLIVSQTTSWCLSATLMLNAHVKSIDFSIDGHYMLTANSQGMVTVWELDTLNAIRIYSLNTKIQQAVFSKDQTQIAIAGDSDSVIILNFPTFTVNKTLATGHGYVWDLDFSYDSNRLLTCGDDGYYRVWKNKQNFQLQMSYEMAGPIYTCEFSRDNDVIGAGNSFVQAWNGGSRKFLDSSFTDQIFWALRTRFSDDYFITGSQDGNLYQYKASDGTKTSIISVISNITSIGYTTDLQYFAVAGSSNKVSIYNGTNRVNLLLQQIETDSTSPFLSARFDPDSKYLGAGNEEGIVYIFSRFCMACDPLCSYCFINSTFCSACQDSGQNQAFLYESNRSCLQQCPDTYYEEISGHTCQRCDNKCKLCQYNSTYCSLCKSSGIHQSFLFQTNSTCLVSCPDGYYAEDDNHTCVKCHSLCELCSVNSTFCTLCKDTQDIKAFLLQSNSTCLQECPDGFYEEQLNNTCVRCSQLCSICEDNATFCLACQDEQNAVYFMENSSCLQTCPEGYYATEDNNTCQECDPLCSACSINQTYCSACSQTFPFQAFLLSAENSCTEECPTGFYEEYQNHTCIKCNELCQQCTQDALNCSLCVFQAFFFWENSSCLSVCPDGYFQDQQNCTQCDIQCQTCTQTQSNCLSCDNVTFLFNFTCIDVCPSSFEPDENSRQCISVSVNINQQQKQDSQPLNKAALIGGVVGTGLVIILMICLILWKKKQQQKNKVSNQSFNDGPRTLIHKQVPKLNKQVNLTLETLKTEQKLNESDLKEHQDTPDINNISQIKSAKESLHEDSYSIQNSKRELVDENKQEIFNMMRKIDQIIIEDDNNPDF